MLLIISVVINIILLIYLFTNNKSMEAKKEHIRFDIYSKNNSITNAQMSDEKTIVFPIEGKDTAVCYVTSNRNDCGKIKIYVE